MSEHPSQIDPSRLLAECEMRFQRRSGPGGQNRNKVETAVILKHRPTGITAEANERRSQEENRREALARLRVNLALDVRTARTEIPGSLWRSRFPSGRIRINPEHSDFPAILAEAPDVAAVMDMDLRRASEALKCSATQLANLLRLEPRALAKVNAKRAEAGLRPLV